MSCYALFRSWMPRRPVSESANFRGVSSIVLLGVVMCNQTAHANNPPATPVITEPTIGRIVNPADCHMECESFSDPNPGDTHLCSDWEIWTITPSQRIWATLCIGGVERVHTHLGDGTFQGSHAGRSELLPNTQYRLRTRHRDSSDDPSTEWSDWGERLFTTGALSQIFPLETDDIAEFPTPTLVDSLSRPLILPGGVGTPARLRIEASSGGLLLEIAGFNGVINQLTNPGTLSVHEPIRVRVIAGDALLTLPDSDLGFTSHEGGAHVIYLPAIGLTPGGEVQFWVASSGSTYNATNTQSSPDFSSLARGSPVPWIARQPGYRVEVVASGFQLPVNIAFVPNPGSSPSSPLYYVTELYGTIKVVTRNGMVHDYATNLLNFNPTGNFPGSGEQGVAGVVVDPTNGDVYATMLYSSIPGVEAAPHYPKVVRFTSNDGGLTAATQTIILNMSGETQGQSHQISNISFGPDGMLYVHMGDGFDAARAQDLNSYRGKILRLTRGGAAPTDNPIYNAGDGINARDYMFAYGVRNPFGGAWRDADASLYCVENGPSVDRFAKIVRGRNYGWNGTDVSMTNFALYNWNPATGPVNVAFIQPGTFSGSQFPAEKQGYAFVTESGPTWASGPQANGKRITEFVLDAAGNRLSGPTTLVEYNGAGKATVAALAAGPDGLYFSDLYKDLDYTSPIDRGANILRVRFVGAADFSANVVNGTAPLSVSFTDQSTVVDPTAWAWDFGDGSTSIVRHPTHVYQHDGMYTVRLTVTGSAGAFVRERTNYIRVGVVPRIAFISSSVPPPAADDAIADDLSAHGYDVTVFDQVNRPTAAQIAANYNLVLVSSTIASGNVAGQFRTVNIPMLFWENALLRSGRESLTDNGTVISANTINIVDNTHPITQGLSTGNLQFFTTNSNMSLGTGTIGAGTRILARRAGGTEIAVMTAEAGATVAGGYVTPARRVFLCFEDSSYLNTTHAAHEMLERAVCWSLNLGAPVISHHPQNTIVCFGGSATFSVTSTAGAIQTYQWRHNGMPIQGATLPYLTINDAAPSNDGVYDVVVSTSCGSTASNVASLTVCYADVDDGTGTGTCDGGVTIEDLLYYLVIFDAGLIRADVDDGTSSGTPDGGVTIDDLLYYLDRFSTGC